MSNRNPLKWSGALQLFCLCCISICTSKSIASSSSSSLNNESLTTAIARNSSKCDELPLVVLQRVLGPAFDARYMSVNRPMDTDSSDYVEMDNNDDLDNQFKRKTEDRPSFYVTEESPRALSNEPAWNMDWEKFGGIRKRSIDNGDAVKKKRSIPSIKLIHHTTIDKELEESIGKMEKDRSNTSPWRCENRVKWMDLGPDYHPSHLRTIECSKDKCYYGQFECRPKHFAVHILRRQRGTCANASNLETYGFVGDFAEVWEWVEVAINFCCDCVVPKHSYYF